MNKIILFFFVVFFSFHVLADCPKAESLYLQKGFSVAQDEFVRCAIYENDDETQLFLAKTYQKGTQYIQPNIMRSLLYYHLSADNGNAEAQTVLAELLLKMDSNDEDRKILVNYIKKVNLAFSRGQTMFKGELLHPYILLLLAYESVGQKWYYPTQTKSYSKAYVLLNQYQISDEKKKTLFSQASRWKQRKMLETAQEVLSYDEYQKFFDTLYPKHGRVDGFMRSQAIKMLQERVKNYLES